MDIFNNNVSILGEFTIASTNAIGSFLTIDSAGIVRFRLPSEVSDDIGIDTSLLVPYIGATTTVDLGSQDFTTAGTGTFNRAYSQNEAIDNNELVRLDQMNSVIAGLHWQVAVLDKIDFTTSEPSTPTDGDRYINTVTGTSSVTTQTVTEDYIYEWNGTDWTETIPEEGYTLWDINDDTNYTYNGTAWVEFGSTVSHNNTTGLQGGTSGEYYHLTSDQYSNLAYTNVGNVFSVDQIISTGEPKLTLEDNTSAINTVTSLIDFDYNAGTAGRIGYQGDSTLLISNYHTTGAINFQTNSASRYKINYEGDHDFQDGDMLTTGKVTANQTSLEYGMSITGGSTAWLLYANAGTGPLYMRDTTNSNMITTWEDDAFVINVDTTIGGKLDLNQAADDIGLTISGFDDQSDSYIDMYVNSSGHAKISQSTSTGTGYLSVEAENYLELKAGTLIYTGDQVRFYDDGVLAFGTGGDFTQNYDSTNDVLNIKASVAGKGLVMDIDGKIGIGETSPTALLHVTQVDATANVLSLGRSDNSSYWTFNQAGNDLRISNSLGTNSDILLGVDAGGTTVGNKVGIGIALPTEILDVYGDARIGGDVTSTVLTIEASDDSASPSVTTSINMIGYGTRSQGTFHTDTSLPNEEWFSGILYAGSFNKWSVGYDATGGQAEYLDNSLFTILDTGKVGIGNNAPTNDLDVNGNISATTIRVGSTASGEGIVRYTAEDGNGIGLTTGTLDETGFGLFVSHSSNNRYVGIGNTAPDEALDVTGNIVVSGTADIASGLLLGSSGADRTVGNELTTRTLFMYGGTSTTTGGSIRLIGEDYGGTDLGGGIAMETTNDAEVSINAPVMIGATGTPSEQLEVVGNIAADSFIPADGNVVLSDVTNEPTGSDNVLNIVSLTQAEYDAGTPVATTIYNIIDA